MFPRVRRVIGLSNIDPALSSPLSPFCGPARVRSRLPFSYHAGAAGRVALIRPSGRESLARPAGRRRHRKTALLEDLIESASDVKIARATGVES
jgi:hypothetical protein